jgi:3-methyladenine DNA glycosylase AlkC
MDVETAKLVDAVAAVASVGDAAAFRKALAALKARVCVAAPGKSIGPGMAFGTLTPAGDTIGLALLAGDWQQSLAFIDIMVSDEKAEIRSAACRAVGHLGQRYPDAVVPAARRLADDPSWEVREFIANALDEIMAQEQGDFLYRLMGEWVHDPEANIRRVPTNALMRYGRLHPQQVLRLMGELLHDDSSYVRDNVVFCLGVMGAVKVPMIGPAGSPENPHILLAALRDWLADDDPRARWIVAKTLGRSWTKACPSEALALLKLLAQDERKPVRNAVASSVKTIAKVHPDAVQAAMQEWASDVSAAVRAAAQVAMAGLSLP